MFRIQYTILLIFSLFLVCGEKPDANPPRANLYLGIPKTDYLTGKFSAEKVFAKVTLDDSSREHYLRPEVKTALLKMITDFEDQKPQNYKQNIFLVSSFRNFSHQKGIWESKYTGKKAMRVPIKDKSPNEIVSLILEFSSAPGTSRHHWGTDFDINSLENSYFEEGGKGKILYDWMKVHAKKYGFCQPYNSLAQRGNKGYQEEKWHWSYAPISNQLTKAWADSFLKSEITLAGSFLGAEILADGALEYVTSISSECALANTPSF